MRRDFPLQLRHDMAVGIHRQGDVTVAEGFHDYAGMDPLGESDFPLIRWS
jgi:hypothetical protein